MLKKIIISLVALIVIISLAIYITGRISSDVHVERILNAPIDKVWHVWTDAESMKSWWSPKDYTAPVIQNDFRDGGKFLFSMRSPKGEMFWNTGKYIEINPKDTIVSVMSFSDETGKIIPGSEVKMPGKWPDEIQVRVTFEEVDGKTKVKIHEIGIPMIMKFFAKLGWEQQLDKLETLL